MKLLIFTYAPAGLGHLRVTDALVNARPAGTQYILLGSIDRFMTWIHRFTSINPFGKIIFKTFQYGLGETIFTWAYRNFLVWTSGAVYEQLRDAIQLNPQNEEIFIIATHFGMAHQIGAVKEKLMKRTGRKLRIIVQVTDDTTQKIWCVRGADLTIVPSKFVKGKLEEYAKAQKMFFRAEVVPYPIADFLTEKLPNDRQKAFLSGNAQINIAVPISGAAVGLNYFLNLIKYLRKISNRYKIHVLVKASPFTEAFILMMKMVPGIDLMIGKNDKEMILLYELMYKNNLIHIEITKPSEQSFKALMSPRRVGGSILLFTAPVGRQEFENLDFLSRHKLIPVRGESKSSIRGINLSRDPKIAAEFIEWGSRSGLFARMTGADFRFSKKALKTSEISSEGAKLFWKMIREKFKNS